MMDSQIFAHKLQPRISVLAKMKYFPIHSEPAFTLFPELPSEIRIKIWSYRLPARGRYLRMKSEALRSMKEVSCFEVASTNDEFRPWASSKFEEPYDDRELLIMLHINQESRMEVKRLFRVLYVGKALGPLSPHPISTSGHRRAFDASKPVFFDPSLDTLSVRYIALQGTFEANLQHKWLRYVQKHLTKARYIKQLEIIYDSSTRGQFVVEDPRFANGFAMFTWSVAVDAGVMKLLEECRGLEVLKLNVDLRGYHGNEDAKEKEFETVQGLVPEARE